MIRIHTKSGDLFTYDEETEFISKNGEIYSTRYYEPCYVKNGTSVDNVPPTFIGILDKTKNVMITLSGNLNPVAQSGVESVELK